ncbi:MAG: hypothetical protein CYG60_11595 [Actinobacteria bacterium]|nr:MAG: hypothetical protein CYG60_11595 [Actinomycetota bacterium]
MRGHDEPLRRPGERHLHQKARRVARHPGRGGRGRGARRVRRAQGLRRFPLRRGAGPGAGTPRRGPLAGTKGADLRAIVEDGGVVLGVCGGYQLMGHHYETPDGEKLPGAGMLDRSSTMNRVIFSGRTCLDGACSAGCRTRCSS